jgi:A/G-specific adenine glycosylase
MTGEKKYSIVRERLLEWYDENKRDYPWRKTTNLYQILITEILLQKTIASNVNNLYEDFFNKYEDFTALNNAKISSLESDIKSLGLSNKRSKTLKDLSEMIISKFNGVIPENPMELKEINGIAEYVSNAYACFGLNHRTLFHDVNIKRIIERVFQLSTNKKKNEVINEKLDMLLPDDDFKHFYWALLDFGSIICAKKNPKCQICTISDYCHYFFTS